MLKIALLETGHSHDECLLTQMVALKSIGAHLTLICTPELKTRNPHFETYVDVFHLIEFTRNALGDFRLMRQVNRYMEAQNIRKAILNTAQGAHIRSLCLKKTSVEYIGVLHEAHKLQGNFTQTVINRKVKKYLVLSDLLAEKTRLPKGISVRSFYPLIFPRFSQTLRKAAGAIWITVVGGPESRSKDLAGFIALLEQVRDEPVQFIFLRPGDIPKADISAFRKQLSKRELEHQVIFPDGYVSAEVLDTYLSHTDFLCPLIQPGAGQNLRDEVPVSFRLSFGYHIPLLMPESYSRLADLQEAACFYSTDEFSKSLNAAIENREEVIARIASVPKWEVTYQQERYLDFVLNR